MQRWLRSIGCVLALSAVSCGARGNANNDFIDNEACTAGQSEACVCESTMADGLRLCGADLRLTACMCDGVDGGLPGDDVAAGFDRPAPMDTPATGLDRGLDTGGPTGPGALGAPCTRLDQCASGVCLPTGRCSRSCAGAADCPTSIGWACTALPGLGPVCGCTPRGAETCNGQDDDRDGVADNGITRCGGACVDLQNDAANCGGCGIACGGGTSCMRGMCLCPASLPTACGGRCVDSRTDPTNCGACGTTCAAGQRCEASRCTSTTTGMCPSSCGASAECGACRTPSDPAGSTYCCLSGLCIYSSTPTCSTDAGLVDLPSLDSLPTDTGSGGGSDGAGLD